MWSVTQNFISCFTITFVCYFIRASFYFFFKETINGYYTWMLKQENFISDWGPKKIDAKYLKILKWSTYDLCSIFKWVFKNINNFVTLTLLSYQESDMVEVELAREERPPEEILPRDYYTVSTSPNFLVFPYRTVHICPWNLLDAMSEPSNR